MTNEHTDLAIISRAKEDNVKLVQLQFTDINGNIKADYDTHRKISRIHRKGDMV